MPKVTTIVGAGQAGLQLAIHLRRKGREVLLVSNKTAMQIKRGNIMSTQGLFSTALAHEKNLGLNFFEDQCPKNNRVTFCIANKDRPTKEITWTGRPRLPFQAIDQRLKFSRWMDEFEKLGGKLILQDITATDLNTLAQQTELLVIAGGKGEISNLFSRDYDKSSHYKPARVLSALYVHGMKPEDIPGIKANLIPGVGEYFCMPGLTLSGQCEMMLFEGIPSGPFDCWQKSDSSETQLARAKQLLEKYIPWEAERCEKISLTDSQAVLCGQYTPVIRKPFIKLSSGRLALGIGDVLILNDPIAGQGANNASRAAAFYANEILKKEDGKFDEAWMTDIFNRFWQQDGRWGTAWSNLLLAPPEKHILKLLEAAQKIPLIADTIAHAFEDPITVFPWILSPKLTQNFIAEAERAQAVQNTSILTFQNNTFSL